MAGGGTAGDTGWLLAVKALKTRLFEVNIPRRVTADL